MSIEPPRGFDLSDRTKLRVSGADRQRYLNGQLTNDIRKAGGDSAIYATILNTKGRINADVFVTAADDAFILDADHGLREQLAGRLERYIIADDVQIEDVTETWALLHVAGELPSEIPLQGKTARANRFGIGGFDLWIASGERERVLQELRSAVEMMSVEAAECFRIERGIPRWGCELTEEIIPVEANLEATAIDYAKGCYIGQEVISRMKMSGQTNKRLCGLVSIAGEPLRAGMRLFNEEAGGREAGWITSAVRSKRLGKEIALGYVKRGIGGAGMRLSAAENGSGTAVVVEIAELPFR